MENPPPVSDTNNSISLTGRDIVDKLKLQQSIRIQDKFDKPCIGNKILQREVLLIIFSNAISDLISCHFDANLSTVIDTIKSIRVTWARRGGSIFDKVHFEYVGRAHNKLLKISFGFS